MSDPQQPVPPQWAPPPLPPAAPSANGAPPIPPYGGAYAAPYTAPVHPQYSGALQQPAPQRPAALGIIAVVLASIAAVTTAPAAIASYQIGVGAGAGLLSLGAGDPFDMGILSPVRDWVLLAEVSFWTGTVLGVWAIVQGIIAIAKRRGRVAGIVAVVIAALAPFVFTLTTWLAFSFGLTEGSGAFVFNT
ncbi:MAG: hypothetical protein QM611_10285 [Microbacterium sp.]|uniref:hypothetical protein n=1 Tax=Microbacterium sp. TaxID=51671 RepID=UPI0039E2CEE5